MAISTVGSNGLNKTEDFTIDGLTVGTGGGSVASNTAVGTNALAANTTASNNTAVGYQAAYANTTGTGSVAIGAYSLYQNTTASGHVAIGYQALYSNTTGLYNIGIGPGVGGVSLSALNNNTTGNNNVAVGVGALGNITTGSSNTALGNFSGYNISTVSNSTFVGQSAGNGTTGGGNTFIGQNAGSAVTSGGKNTILGAYSGNQGGLDIRTSSNRIVLSDGDGNPQVYVDNSGNVIVAPAYRTAARGLVDIPAPGGTISPTACLAMSRWGDAGVMVNFFPTQSSTTSIGNIYNAGLTSTQYNTSSDYRLKENVQPMTGALAKVALLKPCTYTWKSTGEDGQGFIAHELQEVIPDAVCGEKDELNEDGSIKAQGVDTSFLVATLTAAIQELKAEFDEYKRTHP